MNNVMKENNNEQDDATKYVAPTIEIYDIVLEQNILQAGSTEDMPG